jgi:hypothetical protein
MTFILRRKARYNHVKAAGKPLFSGPVNGKNMNQRTVIFLSILTALAVCASARASEDLIFQAYSSSVSSCRQYTSSELSILRASNDPLAIAGAGIINSFKIPASDESRALLELASRIEKTKGTATIALLTYCLDHKLPLIPLEKQIEELLHDDGENALPYYLKAILRGEQGKSEAAISEIKEHNGVRHAKLQS